MTKVEVHYDLTRPLTDELMDAISRAHGFYGLHKVQVEPSLNSLLVEYDASRLKLTDVDRALLSAGLPVQRRLNS